MRNIFIAVIFQIGWFACVLGGAKGELPIALGVALTMLACNLWIKRQKISQELQVVVSVIAIGFVVETINLAVGVYKLTGPTSYPWLCPVWFLLLWALFATTPARSVLLVVRTLLAERTFGGALCRTQLFCWCPFRGGDVF